MYEIIDAIVKLKSDAKVSVTSNDINTLVWHDGNSTNITNKQITDKLAELNADYDSKEYQRKRQAEYPSLEDCIHAILDDDLDNLQAKRTAVKEKYPK